MKEEQFVFVACELGRGVVSVATDVGASVEVGEFVPLEALDVTEPGLCMYVI